MQNTIGEYQCGFTRGKSTVDAIHIIKQTIEKIHEHKMEIEMLFIDFKQAFDSIRKQLKTVMKELQIPNKLRRLVMMTIKTTKIAIKTIKGETEVFEINKGVKQGDSLSATLFNLALEYATRNVNKRTLRTGGGQIVAYADDVVIMTKRREIMKNIEEIVHEGEKIGLKINETKQN